jgi:hypothetical protein
MGWDHGCVLQNHPYGGHRIKPCLAGILADWSGALDGTPIKEEYDG